jgi:hypothetical protein
LSNTFLQGRTFWSFTALHQHIYQVHEMDASLDDSLYEVYEFGASEERSRSRTPRRDGGGGGGGGDDGSPGCGGLDPPLSKSSDRQLMTEIKKRFNRRR